MALSSGGGLTEVLAEGGRIVHPRGAVGIVLKSPMDLRHSYWVRFLDGVEAPLKPSEIMLLAQYKEGEIGDSTITVGRTNLYDRVIYRCIVGSQAGEASDIDRRGIYLPPAALHWSLFSVPEQLEKEETPTWNSEPGTRNVLPDLGQGWVENRSIDRFFASGRRYGAAWQAAWQAVG